MPNVMMLSREVKRVPLDFDAPIGKTWAPLLEWPDKYKFPSCPVCGPPTYVAHGHRSAYGEDLDGKSKGDGLTPEARQLDRMWYAHDLDISLEQKYAMRWYDKLGQHEVDYLIEKGRFNPVIDCPQGCDSPDRGVYKSKEEWQTDCPDCEGRGWTRKQLKAGDILAEDINRQARERGVIHDGINSMLVLRARCELLGFEVNCPECDGQGDIATDELREEADNWTPEEVPEGPGYQMWQTVSEGGPISPVFEAPEELAQWLADHPDGITDQFGYNDWMNVIKEEVFGTEIGTGAPV